MCLLTFCLPANSNSSLLVRKLSQTYWGSGVAGTIHNQNNTLGARQRQVGIPKKTLMASFLDPRTKDMMFFSELDRNEVTKMVRKELIKLAYESIKRDEPAPVAQDDNSDDDESEPEVLDIFKNLSKRSRPSVAYSIDNEKESAIERVDHELRQYIDRVPQMNMMNGRQYSNPLKDFWKKKELDFPLLSQLSRKILCIPATSAPSERVFSRAGLTITKLRASLSNDHANALIFLHDTWEIAEAFQDQRIGMNN